MVVRPFSLCRVFCVLLVHRALWSTIRTGLDPMYQPEPTVYYSPSATVIIIKVCIQRVEVRQLTVLPSLFPLTSQLFMGNTPASRSGGGGREA